MTELDIRAAVANGFAAPEQTALTTYNDNAMDRLGRWLQQADAVFAIAERICETSFVPTAYRKKPDEAAAAMLAGAELGFDPMASLRAFDNINGTPAPKAITLRAVVQSKGHQIRVVESTAERAVVDGRRKGDTEWGAPSIWDIERAKRMPQYKSNPNYQSNPAAMLLARATAEQCRWTASDAIMGMPYAAEEVEDFTPAAPAPAVRRLTVADLDAPPAIEQVPAVDGQMVTREQQKHMFALWRDLGFDGDANRENRLTITAKILGLPELESSNDITAEEAARVIAELERKAATAGGTDA
jgi:hypothetical protein